MRISTHDKLIVYGMTYGVLVPNLARELNPDSTPTNNDDILCCFDFFVPFFHEFKQVAIWEIDGSGPFRTGGENKS